MLDGESVQEKFESPSLQTRMNHGLPQKLLTFLRQYGSRGCGKIT
jgi:hypothetical protein